MARHGDGRLIRWMSFASGPRQMRADAVPAGNVLPFIRRPVLAEPGHDGPMLDATGS
ncbi:hypothetical protein [Methylobacterium nonmethylotrophicum]|uniref:hypothetical protein n=1 Tax=Methylobacterium nonmethylotrophicum TaxID=1141884 RepID=UPI001436B18F|nr:hypothetical protein [Methylobacterium nonmethylotrophicum]